MTEGKDPPKFKPSRAPTADVPRSIASRVSDEDMLRFLARFQHTIIPTIILSVTVWGIYGDAAFNFDLVTNGPWLIISAIALGSAIFSSTLFHISGKMLFQKFNPFTIIFSIFVLWVFGPLMAYASWKAEMQVHDSYITESELKVSLWPSIVWAAFWTCLLLGSRGVRAKYFLRDPEHKVEPNQTSTPDE